MPTLVLDPPPARLGELLEERQRLGLDRRDEVWTGVLHMVPGPGEAHMRVQQQLAELLGPLSRASGLIAIPGVNLGSSDDYRVPDAAVLRELGWGTYASTAALVVEILSQGDETFDKLPFYAEHQVDEVLIVDPQQRTIQWLGLADDVYRPIEQSGVIHLSCAQLAQRIDWPATGTAARPQGRAQPRPGRGPSRPR